ncbi:MAG: hypothetical protein HQL66_13895 [Magnetococcales bacterium]|nr:hypothetical protein [Magnetococcales bacterium]
MTTSNAGKVRTCAIGLFGLLFCVPAAHADLYTCKDNTTGETLWRNRPCSGKETQVAKEATAAPRKEKAADPHPSAAPQAPVDTQAGAPSNAAPMDALSKTVNDRLAGAIANDPQLLQKLMTLQDDPAFRAVLQDKNLIARIQSGKGLEELAKDPRILMLMQHPMVQELKGRTSLP